MSGPGGLRLSEDGAGFAYARGRSGGCPWPSRWSCPRDCGWFWVKDNPGRGSQGGRLSRAGDPRGTIPRVEVVRPRAGGIPRMTVQPGSVYAFESVDLYAMVSGYLKTQDVDIGSRVKKGQVLAEIDVPRETQAVAEAVVAARPGEGPGPPGGRQGQDRGGRPRDGRRDAGPDRGATSIGSWPTASSPRSSTPGSRTSPSGARSSRSSSTSRNTTCEAAVGGRADGPAGGPDRAGQARRGGRQGRAGAGPIRPWPRRRSAWPSLAWPRPGSTSTTPGSSPRSTASSPTATSTPGRSSARRPTAASSPC